MPHDVKAVHPSGKLEISFREDEHLYTDSYGVEYTSVTTLIHSAFPAFDAVSAAEKKSQKTGKPAEQYIEEWKAYGEFCAERGTRTHENCENQILGNYAALHTPVDEDERLRFRAAWYEVEELKNIYAEIKPEFLVFSPRFRMAGSIDMFCRKAGNRYALGDWKFVKELRRKSFGGRNGISKATELIPDCNFFHYALQLNIYWMILQIEGYVPAGSEVELFLKKYNFEKKCFEHVNLPLLPVPALMLLAYNVTSDNLDFCPF